MQIGKLNEWHRHRDSLIQAMKDNSEETCWAVYTDQEKKEKTVYNGQVSSIVAQQTALQAAIIQKSVACTLGCGVPVISVARSLCISRCIKAAIAHEIAALAVLAVELEWVKATHRDNMETHKSNREGCLENAQYRFERRRAYNASIADHYTIRILEEYDECISRLP